jgi:RNA polymerase sigma-70 factor (ECF subfamily)
VISSPLGSADRRERFEAEALPWIADVSRFAFSLTRDEIEAQDVVQDTYLRAFRSWHTYVPGSDCRRWLFTICRNVFLRTRERAPSTIPLESAETDGVVAGAISQAARAHFDRSQRSSELAPAIDRALSRVPEPFRETLVIVDVEDQSYEVAATQLGVPIGTIRSRLSRGRRMMQRELRAHALDFGLASQPILPSRAL